MTVQSPLPIFVIYFIPYRSFKFKSKYSIEAYYKRLYNSKQKCLRKMISKIGNGDGTVTVRASKMKDLLLELENFFSPFEIEFLPKNKKPS
jgi:hypothetical protein